MNSAPWTDIGRLESDVREINSRLGEMARSYEVHQINRNVDRLEYTVREISSVCDGIRYELEALREEMRQIREAHAANKEQP